MKYLLTGRQMKMWEKKAMENYKIPSLLLMERAAQSVVKELNNGTYDLHKVLIVCGTGNNGGDGLAVARMLKMRRIPVEVCMAGAEERLTPDAKQQMEMYRAVSGEFVTTPVCEEYTVIVDAIFGIGCNREITGLAAELIEAVNRAAIPVIAIDIPSGISADTGKLCGYAVKADATVTFFTKKLGMILYPGSEYCGKVIVEALEVPFDRTKECQFLTYATEDLNRLPKRSPDSHKGTFGKVLVIAGSPEICGAAYLAGAGAYRIGAGLVKIYTPKENRSALQVLLPEALLEIYDRDDFQKDSLKKCMEWADAIVIGPGLGTDRTAEEILLYVLEQSTIPLIIDADGINLLAKHKRSLLNCTVPVILTPHVQEMVRLSGEEKEEILRESIETAERFTGEYPVTLVLKNARTVVAKQNELIYINTSGNSGMATGGSGDVLAGILGGLMVQGMEAIEASRLGVYLHGMAGDAAAAVKGAYSMTVSDILDGIAEVIGI